MNDIFATNRLQQSLTWLQNHPFIDGHSISISSPELGFSITSYLKWPEGHHPIGYSATPLVCCVTGVCELSPLQAVSSCSELSCTCRYLSDCNCREHIPKMWLTCLAGSWGINNDLQEFSRICDTRVINWKNNGIGAQIRKPINPLVVWPGWLWTPLGSRKFSSKSQSCNDDSLDGETFPCSKNFFEFFPFQGLSP